MNSLIGKKVGMTRIFDAQGQQIPVTVIEAGPCVVVQRKTRAADGYDAVQVGFGSQKEHRLSKPVAGHLKEHGVAPARWLRELPLAEGEDAKPGQTVTVGDVFKDGEFVDVIGITKGRGFQGVIRRHHMSGQPMAHGHTMHRRVGSVGMRERPGRILRNKRMPGHLGNVRVTTQHLLIVQVRAGDHLLLVRGSVPGPAGGLIEIRKSIKKAAK
jgi:large subunit ribosomal protein L3